MNKILRGRKLIGNPPNPHRIPTYRTGFQRRYQSSPESDTHRVTGFERPIQKTNAGNTPANAHAGNIPQPHPNTKRDTLPRRHASPSPDIRSSPSKNPDASRTPTRHHRPNAGTPNLKPSPDAPLAYTHYPPNKIPTRKPSLQSQYTSPVESDHTPGTAKTNPTQPYQTSPRPNRNPYNHYYLSTNSNQNSVSGTNTPHSNWDQINTSPIHTQPNTLKLGTTPQNTKTTPDHKQKHQTKKNSPHNNRPDRLSNRHPDTPHTKLPHNNNIPNPTPQPSPKSLPDPTPNTRCPQITPTTHTNPNN